jgi:hypothetical protein
MPAFIKNPKDESRWNRAKQSVSESRKKDEKSFTDADWGLVNHIYQSMKKSELLDRFKELLQKAKTAINNDSLNKAKGDLNESLDNEDYEETEGILEPEEASDLGEAIASSSNPSKAKSQSGKTQKVKYKPIDSERLKKLKEIAHHWLNHADQVRKLSADAKKNPHLFGEGHRIAAHNKAHEQFHKEYHDLINSDEYKNLSNVQKMKRELQFKKEFKSKNPDFHANAANYVSEAHGKHNEAKAAYNQEKAGKYAHIISGGHSGGETFSDQEAAQHLGYVKDEEDNYSSSTIKDPFSGFASANKDFLARLNKPKTIEEYQELEPPEAKILRHPSLNNEENKRLLNQFFEEYHPLISYSVNKARNKAKAMGISEDSIDLSALHEAGMHGLMQAVRDYNPEIGPFKNHAQSKMMGLMQSRISADDPISRELRSGAKFYEKTKDMVPKKPKQEPIKMDLPKEAAQSTPSSKEVSAPKIDAHKLISNSSHPSAADMAERMQRIKTIRRRPGS